jgi:acid phosphatase type 7
MRPGLLFLIVLCCGCSGEGSVPSLDRRTLADASPADEAAALLDDLSSSDGAATSLDSTPVGDAKPPAADAAPGVSLRVVVLSDLNGAYGSTSYSSTVKAAVSAATGTLKPDLVVITGDMVAGQQAGLNYNAMWSAFHAAVTTPLLAAGIPVAVTPGNHDGSAYSSFAAERAIFEQQWKAAARVPKVTFIDKTHYPLYYSFTLKGVFFLSLDATTVGPLPSAVRTWVAAQLAAAKSYPIKIAFGHVPLFPVTVGRETEVLGDAPLASVFAQNGLTLLLTGHHHGYYPGVSSKVHQISQPCVGDGPRPLIGTSAATPQGLVRIDITNGKVSSIEALRGATFSQILPRSTLPASLKYGSSTLVRDDLAGAY